jgi:hypothetical protein
MCEYDPRQRHQYQVKLAEQVELLEEFESFIHGCLRQQRICSRESLPGPNEKSDQTCVWAAGCKGSNDDE